MAPVTWVGEGQALHTSTGRPAGLLIVALHAREGRAVVIRSLQGVIGQTPVRVMERFRARTP